VFLISLFYKLTLCAAEYLWCSYGCQITAQQENTCSGKYKTPKEGTTNKSQTISVNVVHIRIYGDINNHKNTCKIERTLNLDIAQIILRSRERSLM
jgi:hypothetical protein